MPLPASKTAVRQSADRVDSEFREKRKVVAAHYTAPKNRSEMEKRRWRWSSEPEGAGLQKVVG